MTTKVKQPKKKAVFFSTVLVKQSLNTGNKTEIKMIDAITSEEMTTDQSSLFFYNIAENGNCVFRGFKYIVK